MQKGRNVMPNKDITAVRCGKSLLLLHNRCRWVSTYVYMNISVRKQVRIPVYMTHMRIYIFKHMQMM